MRRTRIAVVLLTAGLAAVAAGCGGGSKKSSPPTTTSGSTTTTQATTTSGGQTSSGTPSFASAKNCQDLAGIAAKAAAAIQASGNAGTTLNTEANVLQGLANAAPSEIKGDFQTLATAFSGFLQALQKSGFKLGSTTPPTPAQAAALEAAAKKFDTTKVKQAEQHLEAWKNQNCKGVKLGG
jgi:hypothetical protein